MSASSPCDPSIALSLVRQCTVAHLSEPFSPGDVTAGIGDMREGPILRKPRAESNAKPLVEAMGYGTGANPVECRA